MKENPIKYNLTFNRKKEQNGYLIGEMVTSKFASIKSDVKKFWLEK